MMGEENGFAIIKGTDEVANYGDCWQASSDESATLPCIAQAMVYTPLSHYKEYKLTTI